MFVNTAAPEIKGRLSITSGPGVTNCVMCTAAGAVNLAIHTQLTTRDIAGLVPSMKRTAADGYSVDMQAADLTAFVCEKTGRGSQQLGKMAKAFERADDSTNEKPYPEAAHWMQAFADGTVYAVYVSGFLSGGNHSKSHWLNAIKAGGTIRFFDFQANRALQALGQAATGGQNPASARVPILGITSQTEGGSSWDMHSDQQAGAFDTGRTKSLVIAFPP